MTDPSASRSLTGLHPARLLRDRGTWPALVLLVALVSVYAASLPRVVAVMDGGDFGLMLRSRGTVYHAAPAWGDLREWDAVVAVNGTPTPDATLAFALVQAAPPGELHLRLRRGDVEWEASAQGGPKTGLRRWASMVSWCTGLALALLGTLAYALRPRTHVGAVFMGFCAGVAVAFQAAGAIDNGLWGWAVEKGAYGLVGGLGLHLFAVFPRPLRWLAEKPWRAALPHLPGAALVVALATVHPEAPPARLSTHLANAINAWLVVAAVLGLAIVTLRYLRARARLRSHRDLPMYRAILSGIALGLLVPALWNFARNSFLTDRFAGFGLTDLNRVPVVVFALMTAYAIVRHNALAVDRFTAAVLGYTSAIALLGAGLTLVLIGVPALLGEAGPASALASPTASAVATALCVLAVRPLYGVLKTRIDAWFHRTRVDEERYVKELRALSDAIAGGEAESGMKRCLEALSLLEAERVEVWTRRPSGDAFTCSGRNVAAPPEGAQEAGDDADEADASADDVALPESLRLQAALPPDEAPLVSTKETLVSELQARGGAAGVAGLAPHALSEASQAKLWRRRLAMAVPIMAFGEVRGLLGVGRKLSGAAFLPSEVSFVEAVATQLGLAVGAANAQPTQVANYRIEKRLGIGGMAEVYLAWQQGPSGFARKVALKRLRGDMLEDAHLVELFLDEARVAAQLNHANVVRVHEVGEANGQYFIAMEYVEGPNLRGLLKAAKAAGQSVPLNIVLGIADETLLALEYVHGAKDSHGHALKLVHRDVTPSNIQLDAQGVVKLLDFGIARAANQSHVTRTGIVKGTLPYMSFEQGTGQPLDGRSDVYSLGACLFELLTGQKAFPDGPVAPRPTASLQSLRPDVPEAVAAVIERMLAGNRDERFADAGTCRAELLWAASPAIPAGPAERLEWHARMLAYVAEPTRTLPVLGPHGATVSPPRGASPSVPPPPPRLSPAPLSPARLRELPPPVAPAPGPGVPPTVSPPRPSAPRAPAPSSPRFAPGTRPPTGPIGPPQIPAVAVPHPVDSAGAGPRAEGGGAPASGAGPAESAPTLSPAGVLEPRAPVPQATLTVPSPAAQAERVVLEGDAASEADEEPRTVPVRHLGD